MKLHTLLDLRGSIPSFIFISDGKMHDVNILDQLVPEAGAFYVMDRGYLDFERLAHLDDAGSFFVTRAKSNLKARRRYSRPVDRSTGLICDQTVLLTGFYSRQGFDRPLRRIKFNDPQTGKQLVFLTNNFALDALTIAKLYKYRWRWNCSSMDQAAPAHQSVLRHQRECRQIANLDRRLGLRPGRHREKAPRAAGNPLRNSTDFESHPVRENPGR